MIFEPGQGTLEELAAYIEETRHRPCPEAVAFARKHDWTNVDQAPPEFAFQLLVEYLDVLGPAFRAGTVITVGREPFWAARTWMSVPGLTPEEYGYLMMRWWYRYPDMRKRVEEGSLAPGGRAIFTLASGRGRS